MSDVNTGASAPSEDPIAEIKITINEDKVVWDIGRLTLPDVVFWLDTVKHMIMSQVTGESSVSQSER